MITSTNPLRARPIRAPDTVDLLWNLALFAGLWLVYSGIRAAVGDAESGAIANAERLLDLQTAFGLDIEDDVQRLLGATATFMAANAYYLVHFPLTGATVVATFLRDRHRGFIDLRNGLVAVTTAALVIHLLVPMAPPRMLEGFVDAGARYGPDPYSFPGSDGANQFAAMPSLHVAWAILVGRALWSLNHLPGIRLLAIVHPVVTVMVVIITGHHFVTDVAVAASLGAAAWCLTNRRADPPTTEYPASGELQPDAIGPVNRRPSCPRRRPAPVR